MIQRKVKYFLNIEYNVNNEVLDRVYKFEILLNYSVPLIKYWNPGCSFCFVGNLSVSSPDYILNKNILTRECLSVFGHITVCRLKCLRVYIVSYVGLQIWLWVWCSAAIPIAYSYPGPSILMCLICWVFEVLNTKLNCTASM